MHSSSVPWCAQHTIGAAQTSGCNGGASSCNNGNLVSQSITVPSFAATQSYAYDSMNRLYTASEQQGGSTAWSQQFGYDAYSNRSLSSSASPLTPLDSSWFNSKNQIENPSDGSRFDYDAAGNQTAIGLSTLTAAYDAENRMTTNTAVGAEQELYDYDGEGNRVRHRHQTWNSGTSSWSTVSTTLYVYDAFGKLAAEYGAAPANNPCSTCYLTTDMLGSTRMVTDQGGNVVARFDYYPFGEKIMASGTTGRGAVLCGSLSCYPYDVSTPPAVNQLFTGMEHDFDTNLDYDFARYYSGAEGRFLEADIPLIDQYPNDPQSWNLYGYVRNNPLIYVDPDGTTCVNGINVDTGTPCVEGADPRRDPNLNGSSKWVCEWLGLWCVPGGDHAAAHPIKGKTTTPEAPQTTQACSQRGGGFGISLGGNGDLGIGKAAGATLTGSGGLGVFRSSGNGVSGGGFLTGGAAAYVGSHSAGAPVQKGTSVFGAFAGAGVSFFGTNAGSVQQLSGNFSTLNFNVGLGLAQLQVSWASGNGVWEMSASGPRMGLGFGFSVTTINTNTVTTRGHC